MKLWPVAVLLPLPGLCGAEAATPVQTPASVCASMPVDVERLACYDALFAAPPSPSATAPAIATESEAGSATVTDEQAAADRRMVTLPARMLRRLLSYSGTFEPYRPSYLLPYSWSRDPNSAPFSERFGQSSLDAKLNHQEVKFQLSFKLPLMTGVLDEHTRLWFGYTQLSLWQAFNSKESAPFRENNFEPEVFVSYDFSQSIGPGQLEYISLGINHQSNGRADPLSRSWNRLLGQAAYSTDHWTFLLRPWWRIPENNGSDDNPDIEKFLGYADYIAIWRAPGDNEISTKLRNNLQKDNNRTSIEIGWRFPLSDALSGYVEYVNGYGESLIDYNHRQQRIGIGFMVKGWQ